MNVLVFLNSLALGGTEKAACRWATGLAEKGHRVQVLALKEGALRTAFQEHRLPLRVIAPAAEEIASLLREAAPDVIHTHAPGQPHEGDFLGQALALLPRIPVVQTNIFGRFENPKEDAWTDFRLFVSWTSSVQAAQRAFRPLDLNFFRRNSVVVNPVDSAELPAEGEIRNFRRSLGFGGQEVLFGRLSRPEPNKWTDLALDAFRLASRRFPAMKLLLREPPPLIAEKLRASPDAARFLVLPATSDPAELRLTIAALDVVLHTSVLGESFGFGIAEPMILGKPVVTHSVPWGDQAQIELARPGECGFVASTPAAMARAMLRLANDPPLRAQMGAKAQNHIRALADPNVSIGRLEQILLAAREGRDNPFAAEDLARAKTTAAYLRAHQFGHSLSEQVALRPFYLRVRFHQWRNALRQRLSG
jgi:glycosyltransferase involved in cell wall biosynthesis